MYSLYIFTLIFGIYGIKKFIQLCKKEKQINKLFDLISREGFLIYADEILSDDDELKYYYEYAADLAELKKLASEDKFYADLYENYKPILHYCVDKCILSKVDTCKLIKHVRANQLKSSLVPTEEYIRDLIYESVQYLEN